MNYDALGEAEFLKLARSFPSLVGAPGVSGSVFDPLALDAWAVTRASSGAAHAARFVLSLYNTDGKWEAGSFELGRAIGTWDAAHVEAFFKWAELYRARRGADGR